MKTYSAKEVAVLIRKSLKEAFKPVKFSVRLSRGTSSINVEWTDGPNTKQVESVVGVFQGSGFDGMEDYQYKIYHTENGEPVNLYSDFVMLRREVSDEVINRRASLLNLPDDLPTWEAASEVREVTSKLSFCMTSPSVTAERFKVTGTEQEKRQEAFAQREAKAALDREIKSIDEANKRQASTSHLELTNKPSYVKVEWSESREFKEGEEIPFQQFERRCRNLVSSHVDRGYDKTKIEVAFENGDTYGCRLDLGKTSDWGYIDHMNQMIEYANTEKGKAFYEQHDPSLLQFLKSFYKPKLQVVH